MNRLVAVVVFMLLLSPLPSCKREAADDQARIAALEAEVKALRGLVPDQAAVMEIQAYHFTNLWFAVDQENWPLAEFYLSETRQNLKWAVRVRPVRKDKNGADVNIAGIAESLENGPFTQMREAIDARDKARAVKSYKDALAVCYACHEAASKPFLRPRIPAEPQVRLISFTPGAVLPE
jgi:cytochrome c553